MKVNILVLNWNSAKDIKNCLSSINCSRDRDFRVVIINNFSTNEDLIKIRDLFYEFKAVYEIYLVENLLNLGYSGGNNSGYVYLTQNNLEGDVLIMNPDVSISKGTITEMKRALVGDVGIVSIRTLDEQGEILYDAIQCNGFTQRSIITSQDVIESDFSQGSCILIRREIIDRIAFFDERFFMYWEEVDFSLRVKKLGYKLISITTSYVMKSNNSDSRQPAAFYYSVRNARLIKNKHSDLFTTTEYNLYLIKMLFMTFKFILKPRLFTDVFLNFISGIWDSLHQRYYVKGRSHY